MTDKPMKAYAIFAQKTYSLETVSFPLGKKNIVWKKDIAADKIAAAIVRAVGEGLADIVPYPTERSLCFTAEREDGTRLFCKVFYARRSPCAVYRIAGELQAAAGIGEKTVLCKLRRRVYLSVGPFIGGEPLIRACFAMTEAEKEEAGRQVADALVALHGIPPCRGIQRRSPGMDVAREYYRLKLARTRERAVWDLYRFVKSNKAVLRTPCVVCHTDLHPNNILCDIAGGAYRLIDYDAMMLSHPWRDFTPLFFCPEPFYPFLKSLLCRYFGGDVPTEFFRVNAVSMAIFALSCRQFDSRYVGLACEVMGAEQHIPAWWNNT